MAGIGFRLQAMVKGDSYLDLVRAYLYSSLIVAGPLVLVIVFLGVVKWAIQSHLLPEEGRLFQGLIVYNYVFSLIGTSPFIYPLTRYLADKHFVNDVHSYTPTYLSALLITFVFQTIISAPFLAKMPLSVSLQWQMWSLFLMISGIWIAMAFLSAAQKYLWIFGAFAAGVVLGVLASVFLGEKNGFSGYVSGFLMGQALIFIILTIRIFVEFGYTEAYDFGFLLYFRKYAGLVVIGIFYNTGIWIDKLIIWFTPDADIVFGPLRLLSDYDTPMFFAHMTTVPSLAFFLIQMETNFAQQYRNYYDAVRTRSPFSKITDYQTQLRETLSRNFQKFVIFQGTLSGCIILFIVEIATLIELNPRQIGIFRIGILGSFLLMGYLMILNLLFYFDCRRENVLLSGLQCFTNTLLTWISVKIGFVSYGFGFAIANFITIIVGYFILHERVKNLGYWTFMRQPVLLPKFELESDREPQ